jgi:hypothetical protein
MKKRSTERRPQFKYQANLEIHPLPELLFTMGQVQSKSLSVMERLFLLLPTRRKIISANFFFDAAK